MSFGFKGSQGCAGSLTSFGDVSFSGPGGGGTWRICSVGIICASSSSERPASEAWLGNPTAKIAKLRVIKDE
jgi:hypothetical protein